MPKTSDDDPAVQRRRLRTELREMRKNAGQTQREIADAMTWSLSKVIRIEGGEVGITPNDLKVLLQHYGVTDKRRVDELVDVAISARSYSWTDYRDVFAAADLTYFGLEAAASTIRTFSVFVVPGLLQIEEYARAIIFDELGYSGSAQDRRWRARQRRQEIHERGTPPEMFSILDEAVLRRPIGGPRVMRRQLEHLKTFGELGRIHLSVLPFTAGAHPSLRDPFVVLEFPDAKDDDLLYQESAAGAITSREDAEVTSRYLERFYELESRSLSERDTLALLDELIEETSGSSKSKSAAPEAADGSS